jgi:hypothetical protein
MVELAEFLASDFEPIPKCHGDWRLEDPVVAVLSTCTTLHSFIIMSYNFLTFPVSTVDSVLLSDLSPVRAYNHLETLSARRYPLDVTRWPNS